MTNIEESRIKKRMTVLAFQRSMKGMRFPISFQFLPTAAPERTIAMAGIAELRLPRDRGTQHAK